MNRNFAIAALAAAVLLLVGALLWSSGPTEPAPEAQPEAAPAIQAAEAEPSAAPDHPGRPIPAGVIELTPEERARRAAIARERIKQLTAEQRAEIRGELPDQTHTSGPPLGEAQPTPDQEE